MLLTTKKKKSLLAPFEENYKDAIVTFKKHEWYDCEIELNNKLYLCKFYLVPRNCQLTVNNRYIWQIVGGGSSFKTVPKVEKFIEGKDSRKHIKVALLVNNFQQVKRWINECEMEFVDPYTDIYGAKMLNVEKLKDQIIAL